MSRPWASALGCALLAVLGGTWCAPRDHGFRVTSTRPLPPLPGARPVTLVYAGYTRCPDVCPLVLARLAEALRRLPAGTRARVGVVMVSVDPRDRPEDVAAYARRFDPSFVGVAPSPAWRRRFEEAVGVLALPGEAGSLEHVATVLLVERGVPRLIYPLEFDPAGLARDVARRLAPWPWRIGAGTGLRW